MDRDASLDHPDGSLRTLFAMEAIATVLVVGLVLAALAVVAGHRGGVPFGPAPSLLVDPPVNSPLPARSGAAVNSGGTIVAASPDASGTAGRTASTLTTRTSAHGPASSPQPGTGATATRTARPPASPPARSPHCLRVTHVVNSQWPGGLNAQFTVANCGTATINGWTVSVYFSGPVSIQVWNATASGGSTSVHFSSVSYDTTITPGAGVTFGFNATWASNAGSRSISGCGVASGTCS